jgi:hypothetical protein
MSGAGVPRDDRAWPRGSFAVSAVLVLIAVGSGVALVVAAASLGTLPATFVAGGFVAAFGFGLAAAVPAMRRAIAGRDIPARLTLLQLVGLVVAFVVMALSGGVGGAMLAGLIGGLLVANMWAIRTARANRAIVDAAEASLARTPPPDEPPPAGPPAAAPTTSTYVELLGPALRHTVALERQRSLAWLVAGAVVAVGGVALDVPGPVLGLLILTSVAATVWVLRRLVGGWLALRDFDRGTAPRRAYVVLLQDPAPRMIRPLLGVWSDAPVPRGGRLPKPEGVYRCDDERDDLLCHQGSVVVHEAWVDTGRKPRWVAADAGIALPHRRALLGRWYLSNLIGGERPGPPRPLISPPPHPAYRPVVESARTVGSFRRRLLGDWPWCAASGCWSTGSPDHGYRSAFNAPDARAGI